MEKHLTLPITDEIADSLRIGDYVYLSGEVYVARDAAHKRFMECLKEGRKLPFEPQGATIYYMGPSPAREGRVIGSAGPTTASRMDKYTPSLLKLGVKAMIGKGKRSKEVLEAIKENHCVYFAAIGGEGALLSQKIISSEVIAYEDLGAEALRKLYVEDMPLVVIIDSEGNNLYESGRAEYLRQHNE